MDLREQNIKRQHDELGINRATLQETDRKCIVCWEPLLTVGEGYAGRTRFICSSQFCNCMYSLV